MSMGTSHAVAHMLPGGVRLPCPAPSSPLAVQFLNELLMRRDSRSGARRRAYEARRRQAALPCAVKPTHRFTIWKEQVYDAPHLRLGTAQRRT